MERRCAMSKVVINILDPSCTEFNRGSFCYAPYLLYNYLNSLNTIDLVMYETIRPEDIDTVRPAEINIVALWAYPQIEAAAFFQQFLPFSNPDTKVYFIGYTPLIEALGLPSVAEFLGFSPLLDSTFLKIAMQSYPSNYENFKRLLLSDCDMHLKSLETGQLVYPLFTSYGCPNGCGFCPSTVNCGKTRISLTVEETLAVFSRLERIGIKHIHLTDEDFFYSPSRAYGILEGLQNKGFHIIALGSARVVRNFITRYGVDVLHAAGIEVVEIGFESGSEAVSTSMGAGKSLDDCRALAEIQDFLPFRIFWLVQTFAPGETLQTLTDTGRFMRKYGLSTDEVVGRLRTNGTKGGLGQFFQRYVGTPFNTVPGISLTERPIRLLPSYLPKTFLNSTFPDTLSIGENPMEWLRLYGVESEGTYLIKIHSSLRDTTVWQLLNDNMSNLQIRRMAMAIAILARLGWYENN